MLRKWLMVNKLNPGYLYYALLMFIFYADVYAHRQTTDRCSAHKNGYAGKRRACRQPGEPRRK